jgi:hypothetical protein
MRFGGIRLHGLRHADSASDGGAKQVEKAIVGKCKSFIREYRKLVSSVVRSLIVRILACLDHSSIYNMINRKLKSKLKNN